MVWLKLRIRRGESTVLLFGSPPLGHSVRKKPSQSLLGRDGLVGFPARMKDLDSKLADGEADVII